MLASLGNYSGYTFHGATWRVEQLVDSVASAGYAVAGLSDLGGLRGGVAFSQACEAAGMRMVLGCRLRVNALAVGEVQVTLRTEAGYAALNRLVSGAVDSTVEFAQLAALQNEAAQAVWLSYPVRPRRVLGKRLGGLHAWRAGWAQLKVLDCDNLWVELGWQNDAERQLQRRVYAELCREGWERWVVMTGARQAAQADAPDCLETLQSIGTLTCVGQRHPDKLLDGDYSLPRATDLQQRFARSPQVLAATARFVAACQFDFHYGRIYLPGQIDRMTAQRKLRWRCLRGIVRRYGAAYPWPQRPPRKALRERLQRELAIVAETGYAGYFLIFAAIIDECERRNIPVLARGSAAGSLICYCLGVGNVCPFRFGLSFERFLNRERMRHSKLPDIDLDLPWDRRDEIIAWVYRQFGEAHVAIIGGVSTYQGRAAVAEVAKANGIPADEVYRWTRRLPHGSLAKFLARPADYVEAAEARADVRFADVMAVAARIEGLPRHPMMHPCGIVIADRPIVDFSAVEWSGKGYRMTQLDMHGIEALGLLKLDLLGQAGLSVLRDCRANLEGEGITDTRPRRFDHSALFAMARTGGARGVFHIESPAMTGLLKQCQCADIDCLVATVSVIRPGAANEDKKAKFARRYLGIESAQYADPCLEPVLRDSYGLLIYEEHILLVANTFAGMDLGTADVLRRILIKKSEGAALEELENVFRSAARRRGRSEQAIESVWRELCDFSGFMFNKAHGAAYAVEAYHGLWLKYHWPLHFLAAVLNNQRGFYSAQVYVMEILRNGGQLLLPSVLDLHNAYRCHGTTVQMPLWAIEGLTKDFIRRWQATRSARAFADWEDFVARTGIDAADARRLARAGALRAWFPNRHAALWHAELLGRRPGKNLNPQTELFGAADRTGAASAVGDAAPDFPEPSVRDCAAWEAEAFGFPVSLHPCTFWLAGVEREGTQPLSAAAQLDEGQGMDVCGVQVCLRTHRSRDGRLMKFVSLADESAVLEVILFPDVYRSLGLRWSRQAAVRCRICRKGDAFLVCDD